MLAFAELVAEFDAPVDWAQANPALVHAVQRHDSISELEYLGVSARTLSLLEFSQYRIGTLEDLLEQSREDLLLIDHIGPSAVQEVMNGLGRYHLLDERKERMEQGWDVELTAGIEDLPRAIKAGEVSVVGSTPTNSCPRKSVARPLDGS